MEIYPVKRASVLPLGKQGENLARQIQFDLADWVSSFGPGTVQLLHQRSGDDAPYPVAVAQEGNLAIWTVTGGDTAFAGTGRAELQYYVGDALAKSETWRTRVLAALGPASQTPPEAQQGWVDQVLQAGTEAAKAAAAAVHQPMVGSNGNWWTWDLEAGAYGDTGVPAEGPPGTVELETAGSDRKVAWQFTEGMPEDKGLTYTGTEGKAVMQSGGLLISPGAAYQPPVLAAGKASVECVFSSPNFGDYYGFRLQLTNGTTGIRISCYDNALIYNQHTDNNLTLAKLTTDTQYTLRIAWDEESGADVYLNGEVVLTGGKTSYALAENLVSQVSGGGAILLKSLAYTFPGMGDEIVSIDGKGLRDETARAMAAQGGGGGGLTVTNTAAVGQTVRITAVDETGQPTGWEAVDMASGTAVTPELLYSGTAENVTSFQQALDFKGHRNLAIVVSGTKGDAAISMVEGNLYMDGNRFVFAYYSSFLSATSESAPNGCVVYTICRIGPDRCRVDFSQFANYGAPFWTYLQASSSTQASARTCYLKSAASTAYEKISVSFSASVPAVAVEIYGF